MLHHIRQFFWQIIIVIILATLILLGLVNLSTEKVIAAVTQLGNPPGEVIYRSQVKLDDQTGKVWQVVLFKQVYSDQPSQINLRLIGFPGSAELIHPQPLKITSTTGKVWNAVDLFLDESPAPTIGQYDFTQILPQLPSESLNLSIPLAAANFINISVPAFVVKEWKSLITTEKAKI